MTANFNCPSCGAMLEYKSGEATILCPYCNNSVVPPPEVRQAADEQTISESVKNMAPWVKVFIIGTIIIIVVPSCIGIIGSLIGIVVGIGAPILAVVLSFMGK
jgi:LSD1 subclass zinc finger protein